MRLLRQDQYHPYKQHEQVLLLTAALGHVFAGIEANRVPAVSRALLDAAHAEIPDLCDRIDRTGQTSDDDRKALLEFAKSFVARAES